MRTNSPRRRLSRTGKLRNQQTFNHSKTEQFPAFSGESINPRLGISVPVLRCNPGTLSGRMIDFPRPNWPPPKTCQSDNSATAAWITGQSPTQPKPQYIFHNRKTDFHSRFTNPLARQLPMNTEGEWERVSERCRLDDKSSLMPCEHKSCLCPQLGVRPGDRSIHCEIRCSNTTWWFLDFPAWTKSRMNSAISGAIPIPGITISCWERAA